MDESQIIIAAGTVTTAHILSVISFHIIKNPHVLTKLQEELRTVRPDGQIQLPWHKLEQLPYLVRCVFTGRRDFTMGTMLTVYRMLLLMKGSGMAAPSF